MYSRISSLLFFFIACTSAFWNVNATTTRVTATEGHSHSVASISTMDLPPDSSAATVGETSRPPEEVISSSSPTSSSASSTAVHSTERTLVTAPVKNSPESTTSHLSIAAPQTGNVSSTVIASTTLLSSVSASEKELLSSTDNSSSNTETAPSTQDISAPQNNSTMRLPLEANTTLASDTRGNGMKYSETVLTSIFSTILVVVLLTILAFCFTKYKKQRSQYSHRPLHENGHESEGYSPPDDTLVISGGLYDAPRIYNPSMTILEEEDSQPDYVSFSSRPGQFRLQFLPDDKDMDPSMVP